MNKIGWMFPLFIFASLALISNKSSAEQEGPDFFNVRGVGYNDVLVMRESPSNQASRVGEIPSDGEHIASLGCSGGTSYSISGGSTESGGKKYSKRWCKVRYRGTVGYVKGVYLSADYK